MVIPVTCESCGHTFNAKDELAGKQTQCPECDAGLLVPLQEGATAASDITPAPTPHVEDLSEDAFSPAALGAGVGMAVVAAAVWAFVYHQFSHEHGLVAWAVGGAVGFAMVAAGGRGLPMAVTAAVLSLAAIGGGKLAGMYFAVQSEVQAYMDEDFTREAYDERVVDARDYTALGEGASDEGLTAYLNEHNFVYDEEDASISESLSDFRQGEGRALLAFHADSLNFDSWREQSKAMALEGFSYVKAAKDELAMVDILFAFFGLATAFKLLMRATGVAR